MKKACVVVDLNFRRVKSRRLYIKVDSVDEHESRLSSTKYKVEELSDFFLFSEEVNRNVENHRILVNVFSIQHLEVEFKIEVGSTIF